MESTSQTYLPEVKKITNRHEKAIRLKAADHKTDEVRDMAQMRIKRVLHSLEAELNGIGEENAALKNTLQKILSELKKSEIPLTILTDSETSDAEIKVEATPEQKDAERIKNFRMILTLAKQLLSSINVSKNQKEKILSVIETTQRQIETIEANKENEETEEETARIADLKKTVLTRTARLETKEKRHVELLSEMKNFIEALDKSDQEIIAAVEKLKMYLLKNDIFVSEAEKSRFMEKLGLQDELDLQVIFEKEKPSEEKEEEDDEKIELPRFGKTLRVGAFLVLASLLSFGGTMFYLGNQNYRKRTALREKRAKVRQMNFEKRLIWNRPYYKQYDVEARKATIESEAKKEPLFFKEIDHIEWNTPAKKIREIFLKEWSLTLKEELPKLLCKGPACNDVPKIFTIFVHTTHGNDYAYAKFTAVRTGIKSRTGRYKYEVSIEFKGTYKDSYGLMYDPDTKINVIVRSTDDKK